jgi:hypothetical protein
VAVSPTDLDSLLSLANLELFVFSLILIGTWSGSVSYLAHGLMTQLALLIYHRPHRYPEVLMDLVLHPREASHSQIGCHGAEA